MSVHRSKYQSQGIFSGAQSDSVLWEVSHFFVVSEEVSRLKLTGKDFFAFSLKNPDLATHMAAQQLSCFFVFKPFDHPLVLSEHCRPTKSHWISFESREFPEVSAAVLSNR